VSTLPKYLYHGTRAVHLPAILEQDLLPRRETGVSQWEHTAASHENAVYLTTAYPLYYAINAQAEGDLLVLEIDTDCLDPALLVSDEDALAHCLREPETAGMSLLERTVYYRERISGYSAEFSLARLGTCAHLGAIPKRAVRRAVRIEPQHTGILVLGGFDPVIHPVNYQFHGAEYIEAVSWLFKDTTVCAINPRMPNIPREVLLVTADE
jgi:hypothetical protein